MSVTDPARMAATFEKLFNAGDLEGLVALYEKDALFVAPDGTELRGLDGVRAALQGFLSLGGKAKLDKVYCNVNGDMALASARWSVVGGNAPPGMGGKTAEVLRKQVDGSWLFMIDSPAGGA